MEKRREQSEQQYIDKDFGVAQIIFGDKIMFIDFPTDYSLVDLKKRAILGTASALYPSFSSVSEYEININEYQDFIFYIEDYSGRKIPLLGKEEQFATILRFFSYKVIVYIDLENNLSPPN